MTEGSRATSAGALLRAARESRGLHIAALAAAIKVTPRKLDALENDRWNELPDLTFARALALTVCRSLKIDAKPVLDLLPPAEPLPLDSGTLNEPFREHAARDERSLSALAIKPMVAAAFVLALAAIGVYLMPADWWPASEQASVSVRPAIATTAGPTPAVLDGDAATRSATAVGEAASASSHEAPLAIPVAQASAPQVEQVAQAAPGSQAAAARAVPAGDAAAQLGALRAGANDGVNHAVNGSLQLRARLSSWVEVRDAQGRVLLSRTLQPDEAVALDHEPPLRLVIGNAAATDVRFRGQPVPLGPHTRDAIARLELK